MSDEELLNNIENLNAEMSKLLWVNDDKYDRLSDLSDECRKEIEKRLSKNK